MAKFKLGEGGKKVLGFIKEKASINPFTTGTFFLSAANLATNLHRKKTDTKFQEKQIKATSDLTNALTGVDKTLKESSLMKKETPRKRDRGFLGLFSSTEESNSSMIKFRKKDFSVIGDTIKGASIGASIGGLSAGIFPKEIKNNKFLGLNVSDSTRDKYNTTNKNLRKVAAVAGGTIIGAALGALVGTVKNLDEFNSKRSITGDRLMTDIVSNLKKLSFSEGEDFTRDPKMANQLRTKVCIVISRVSGDLRVLINTISDSKLKTITDETVNNIKNSSVVNNTASNNYNEITISTISDGSADAGLVTGICEKFIRSGYPVYLVEVG